MSLAVPAFADLTKATRAVLYGDAQGEGAFLAGGVAKLSATTATADGVALNLAASVADGAVSPSVTAMFSPSKATMLMAILGPGSSLTGAVTQSGLAGVPGLQATLTAAPPGLNAASSSSLTLDYAHPLARLRAIVSPNAAFSSAAADLSATGSVGPAVLGARIAGDAATGQLQQWGVGASWTRLVTGDDMPATPDNAAASASSLSGQQWGVLLNDAGSAGRSMTFSLHQLLHGGRTCLAAEYTTDLPAAAGLPPSAASNGPNSLVLGIARRLDTGGLLKGRLDEQGRVGLLYQQSLNGGGKLALTCQLDPMHLGKVAPSLGFALSVA